jgi:acetolactate synthase small subunit
MSVTFPTPPTVAEHGDAAPAHRDVERWSVTVSDAPDALVRVLVALRRRRCAIQSVDFVVGDRHRPGRLLISLRPPPRLAHCVGPWLEKLVDVLEAETADA